MIPQRRSSSSQFPGFTLVELMVSVSIIGLIMIVLLSMTNQISSTWRSTTGKIEQYQQARSGFESMTRKLSQATLNTFWDFTYVTGTGGIRTPTAFRRNSELRFAAGPMTLLAPTPASGHNYPTHGVFFQAPFGYTDQPGMQDMANVLNTWGFFVDFADDTPNNPAFLKNMPNGWPSSVGFRLTEFQQATEKMSVYNWDPSRWDAGISPPPGSDPLGWFQDTLTGVGGATPPTRVLAQNVIALIIWPKLSKETEDARRLLGESSISPDYIYDSSCTVPGMYTNPQTNIYFNTGASALSLSNVSDAGGINPKNQIPPVLQVTMVALDAQSAARLVDPLGHSLLPTFDAFTTGLFVNAYSPPFPAPPPGTPSQYDNDLATLENRLLNPSTVSTALGVGPLHYRIFTTNVMIRGAKWSSFETN